MVERLGKSEGYVLAADTVVACGRRILPKAEDMDTAERCLRLLSGRRHRVYTGVAVSAPDGRDSASCRDDHVTLKRLGSEQLVHYLQSGEWQGKAGGYGIQGRADAFVTAIQGSYSNVVGCRFRSRRPPARPRLSWFVVKGGRELLSEDLIVEMTPFGARTALMRHGELLEMRFTDNEIADIRGKVFLRACKPG